MIVIDDILLFPGRSLFFIFKEIHKAALEELEKEAESIRQELSALYLKLESGGVTEDEFDRLESALLDRLDALEEMGAGESDDEDEPDGDTAAAEELE